MKEQSIRTGIIAVGLAAVVGIGLAVVLISQPSDTERAVTGAAPQSGQAVDIATDYDPVAAGDPLPQGFRQLLGRDQIEPIYDPEYTSRDQVDWPDDMLILGVAGETTQKAYPITHLNQHEMVIDEIDGLPILVSW